MYSLNNIDIYHIIACAFVLLTCFPIHEYAHALAAVTLGDQTPVNDGRLSLNPMDHLDLWGSIALFAFGFGWARPVRTRIENFKNRRVGMAITAFAGPLANIILAMIIMIVKKVIIGVVSGGAMGQNSAIFVATDLLDTMIGINLTLALLNLLPIPPLDGSRMVSAVIPPRYEYWLSRHEGAVTVVLLLLLYTGVLGIPLRIASSAVYSGLNFITRPVDMLMGML